LVIVTAIAFASLGLGARQLLGRDSRQAAQAPAAPRSGETEHVQTLSETLARTRQELATVRRTQQVLAAEQSALQAKVNQSASASPVDPIGPSDDEADEAAVQQRIAEEGVATERRYETLAQELTGEPRDLKWAAGTEIAIQSQLNDSPAAAGSVIRSIECRSTLCRAEVAFSSADDARRFRPPHVAGITRGTSHVYDRESDHPRMILYLARGDRSLHPLNRPVPESDPTEQNH